MPMLCPEGHNELEVMEQLQKPLDALQVHPSLFPQGTQTYCRFGSTTADHVKEDEALLAETRSQHLIAKLKPAVQALEPLPT